MVARRASAYLALAAVLAAMPEGCPVRADAAPIVLQTLAKPGSDEYRLLEAVLAKFNKRRPGMQVSLAGGRLKLDYLMRRILAGEAAEVVEVRADEVTSLVERGAVSRLTADCMSPYLDCHPATWGQGMVDKKLYAVPWAARPMLLLYNRAALREAGLRGDQPLETWDQLLQAAERLTRDTDGDGVKDVYGFALAGKCSADLGRHYAVFLAQLGVPLLESREGAWYFNLGSRQGRRVMGFLLELQNYAPPECVVTDNEAALEQFRSGKAAMVMADPGGLACSGGVLREDQVGVAPGPAPAEGETRCDAGFRYVCIPAFVRGSRKEAALELVRFIAGADAQEIVARGVDGCTPVISVRSEVLRGEWYVGRPRLRCFAGALQHTAPVFPPLIWQGKCLEDWLGGIHSLLIGDRRSVQQVADMAQEKGNQALSCLYTTVGHPSLTVVLGMSVVGVLVFVVVAYAVSER